MTRTPETPFKFPLGQVVATPGVLESLRELGIEPRSLLSRHVRGDWGNMEEEDLEANQRALQDGSRIFSAYWVREDIRIWVITEAEDEDGQRLATTILLPEEY